MKPQKFSFGLYILFLFIIPYNFIFAYNTLTNEPLATASEVFVVYNSSYTTDSDSDGTQDSLEIANYYKNKRSIPNANVVGVAMPTTESITRSDYDTYIKAGIESALTSAGLANTIKYIVLTKGVPLKVKDGAHSNEFYMSYTADYASVDSSVTLLYQTYTNVGKVNNPYYAHSSGHTTVLDYRFKPNSFKDTGYVGSPSEATLKYLVTRLDGYTIADIENMIDRAYSADTTSTGYFVFDEYNASRTFRYINDSQAISTLNTLSMNSYLNGVDSASSYIITAPGSVVGYTGYGTYSGFPNDYYNNTLNFTYLNGAVTSTYESYAAFHMTSPDTTNHGQIAQFIHAGGSGGIGNVFEPYSDAIANEDIWMPAYALGYTWADAAYMSLAYLDWTTVVLGDPLMQIVINDTTPPTLSGITPIPSTTTATITWTTDENASTSVSYGTTASYGTTTTETNTSPRVTSHSVSLSSLVCNTTYHYKVISTDFSINTTSDTDHTFDTTACPDITVPVLSSIISTPSTTGANIIWTTDENSSSSVSYGTTSSYGTNTTETDTSPRVTSHSVSFSGLVCNTIYHFKVISTDASANTSSDTDHTFQTSSCSSGNVGGGSGGGGSRGSHNSYVPPIVPPVVILDNKIIIPDTTLKKHTDIPIIPIVIHLPVNQVKNFIVGNTIKPGAKGDSVKILQTFLQAQGPDIFPENIKIDGKFGPSTFEAVKKFQKKNNLLADGIVGKKTKLAMDTLNASKYCLAVPVGKKTC